MSSVEWFVNKNNWPQDLEYARAFAHEAVNTWKWKRKSETIKQEIDAATSVARLQQLVIYPLLSGEGLTVIK